MKVVHINTYDSGGAAWCAKRIHKALKAEGIDSKMLLARGTASEDVSIAPSCDTYPWSKKFVIRKVQALFCKLHLWPQIEYYQHQLEKVADKEGYYTLPLSNNSELWKHPLVQEADVVHLHWVKDFIDYPSFFKHCNKPIVWTLHDKNPAVGLMHYCSEFFSIPTQMIRLDKRVRMLKRQSILKAKNLHIVAISELMKQICQSSDILKGFPCSLIHNGVDVDIFTQYEKRETRVDIAQKYNCPEILKTDVTVFMFSAFGIWDKNKGLQRVIDALEQANCKNIILIVVGRTSQGEEPQASFPILCTDLIIDQAELSKIYSASDFFIQSSLEETFAQTPLEAMACGTPVISTPVSGALDLIRPFNGVLCSGYSSNDLQKGIQQALSIRYDSREIRDYIVREYNYSKIAKEYISLYFTVACYATQEKKTNNA